MHDLDKFENLADDGILMPDPIGLWSRKKHRLLFNYADRFASRMRGSWDELVYIDLFSSAGRAPIKDSSNIVETSAMLALGIHNKFDHYIFCEKEASYLTALKTRASTRYPNIEPKYIEGDVNEKADEILEKLPEFSSRHKVLSFCFVDPFNLSSIHFKTIQTLSKYRMDFLVLIPTGMGPTRQRQNYTDLSSRTVELFLNKQDWRDEWERQKQQNVGFGLFVAGQFSQAMYNINYKFGGLHESELIIYAPKNINLYRLGFYSEHPLGEKFWSETKKYSDPQGSLFE